MKHALTILLASAMVARAQVQYAFTNFVGMPGVSGSNDGTGSSALLWDPAGLAMDSTESLYVADFVNCTIRKVTREGVVTTLAGSAGQAGYFDGVGSSALFSGPYGVAADSAGNVYVTEQKNYTVRKITPEGAVTTLAGLAGQQGSDDGTGSDARFSLPEGVAVDSNGNVYVTDSINNTIRKITPTGVVTTLAGSAGQTGSVDGIGTAARFHWPNGVAVDGGGNIYVADNANYTIRKITPDGMVTTLAGSAGQSGSADGAGSVARFGLPKFVALDDANNLYVTDDETIRKVTPAGVVTTLAGSAGQTGSADGIGSAARFHFVDSVAVDKAGNLFVSDAGNNRITKGTPLTLSAPLQFATGTGSSTVSNGLFQMHLTGPSGTYVAVEASDNLQAWILIQTNTLTSTGLDLSVPLGTNQTQFFRARLVP